MASQRSAAVQIWTCTPIHLSAGISLRRSRSSASVPRLRNESAAPARAFQNFLPPKMSRHILGQCLRHLPEAPSDRSTPPLYKTQLTRVLFLTRRRSTPSTDGKEPVALTSSPWHWHLCLNETLSLTGSSSKSECTLLYAITLNIPLSHLIAMYYR